MRKAKNKTRKLKTGLTARSLEEEAGHGHFDRKPPPAHVLHFCVQSPLDEMHLSEKTRRSNRTD